jgi:hypothetical protein
MRQITIITPAESGVHSSSQTSLLLPKGVYRAVKLSTTLASSYDLVLYTSTPGAAQTAQVVAKHDSGTPQEVIKPSDMTKSPLDMELIQAINKLGDAPLSDYFARGHEDAVRFAGYQYYNEISQKIDTSNSFWILIVTDAILVHMLTMIFAHHVPEEKFLSKKLQPCEGYKLSSSSPSSRFLITEIALHKPRDN